MSFEDKVVLITGAGSGIGKAIALEFAKLSVKLCLLDNNAATLYEVGERCGELSHTKVFCVTADVSKYFQIKQSIKDTIEEYKRLDVVINCAGIAIVADIMNSEFLEFFDRHIDVNLKSIAAMTHYAASELIKTKGCIINISSVYSSIVDKTCIPYSTTKAGVTHFTKNAALELSEHGVRVNCIAPGVVATNLLTNSGISKEGIAKIVEASMSGPLKHTLQVEEIAELAVFLASDKAKSITGAEYVIDSGYSLLRTLWKD